MTGMLLRVVRAVFRGLAFKIFDEKSTPGDILLEILGRCFRLRFGLSGYPITISGRDLDSWCIPSRHRIPMYLLGLKPRLDELSAQYLNVLQDLSDGGVVVDCGANVGEFSYLAAKQGFDVFAFEPSPAVCACLTKNVEGLSVAVCQYGLWNECTVKTLYLADDTADSNILESIAQGQEVTEVEVIRLDEFSPLEEIPVIELLKVEGEGVEPEILEGCANILEKVKFIVVDCGPERGMAQSTTDAAVCEILNSYGFAEMERGDSRLILKFSNTRFM